MNGFSQYAYMQQQQPQLTPEQKRQQLANQFAQQIIGQPTQNIGQGVGQLAAGIGLGLSKYRQQGEQFPVAPGGAKPSIMTGLANFFTGRNNGGLF